MAFDIRTEHRIAVVRKARMAVHSAEIAVKAREENMFDSTPEIDALIDKLGVFATEVDGMVAAAEEAIGLRSDGRMVRGGNKS